MDVAVPVRRAAVLVLALDVVPDRAPVRDRAVLPAAVPSPAAAPSPRMDPNHRWKSPVPALVPSNATPSRSPVPGHRSATSPARDPAPSPNVGRAAAPSPRTTSRALVPRGTRTRVPVPGPGIVLARRTSVTNPAPFHPKTMTTHRTGITKATRTSLGAVVRIGKVQYFYILFLHTHIQYSQRLVLDMKMWISKL